MPVDPKDTPSQNAALGELAWALGVARDWPGFRDSKWEACNALYSWLVPALLAERRHVELMQRAGAYDCTCLALVDGEHSSSCPQVDR